LIIAISPDTAIAFAYAISLSMPLFSLADDIADIIFAIIFADYARLHITPRH
jgi:hypothetical protein